MLLSAGQTIVFAGDSITAAGRDNPALGPLGGGYVRQFQGLWQAAHPQVPLTLFNAGFNGNTSRDLAHNWPQQVLARRPDWVSVLIGVNDTWRDYDGHPQLAVHPDEYQATLDRLLGQSGQLGARPVLLTPFLIEPDHGDPMRRGVVDLAARLPALARRHGAVLVPLQPLFDAAMQRTAPRLLAPDRVHPTEVGAAIIAQALLRALGGG